MKPHVESVDVLVCADGFVEFDHPKFGRTVECIHRIGGPLCETPGLAGCEESSAVEGGSAATSAEQRRQYFSSEPLERSASRPQASQYLVSKTSASGCFWAGVAITAISAVCFICGALWAFMEGK